MVVALQSSSRQKPTGTASRRDDHVMLVRARHRVFLEQVSTKRFVSATVVALFNMCVIGIPFTALVSAIQVASVGLFLM